LSCICSGVWQAARASLSSHSCCFGRWHLSAARRALYARAWHVASSVLLSLHVLCSTRWPARLTLPFDQDTHDLFATLIVSLQLQTHRQYFKTYHNSFTTDEAAENLAALKFSQSNRAPDPKEPSRVVTTTTTTTFSMNRDMAKGICQHFMDARLIENAADQGSSIFKDKGVYLITPKGLHILERFITKNGINGEHLLKVFSSQPICMKLLHLERRSHDDELLINRPVIEVIFRRFVGRQPNYPPTAAGASSDGAAPSEGDFDRTMGIEMQDIIDKIKPAKGGSATRVMKHCFSAIAALDWLCDFTTICGRDEAAEVAAHFVRLGLIELVMDRSRKDSDEHANIAVRGDDGSGRITEGEFRCHYKAMYGCTDRGRGVARWPGYAHLAEMQQTQSFHSGAGLEEDMQHALNISGANSGADGGSTASGKPDGSKNGSAGTENSGSNGGLARRPSASERLRSEFVAHGGNGASSSQPSLHLGDSITTGGPGGSSTYNSRDSNTNRLKQILEEPALRSLFREFLKQNFCEENLSFWLDVQDFKRRFHTTSSAVAVRPGAPGADAKGSSAGGGMASAVGRRLGRGGQSSSTNQYGFTAMERHQQDLIAMAFVIYNTYLAPASPCELNIEHNLRADLVAYMNKVISDAKGPGGEGVESVSAQEVRGQTQGFNASAPGSSQGHGSGGVGGLEERRAAVHASMPKAPLHASQLQTMVRLYERIQDHIFRLMATDSVPRFIKDARFLSLVRSVEEYTEALESGRLDPNDSSGPAIGKAVVDAMELGEMRASAATSAAPLRVASSSGGPIAK
jgi:hypothetical protein